VARGPIDRLMSPVAASWFEPAESTGMSFGFSSTLEGAMWPEIYGTAHLGAIRSVVVAMMVLASAVGPGLAGYLIDAGVDYSLQLALMGIYSLAAASVVWRVSRRLTMGSVNAKNIASS
jgi:hypothetical protein